MLSTVGVAPPWTDTREDTRQIKRGSNQMVTAPFQRFVNYDLALIDTCVIDTLGLSNAEECLAVRVTELADTHQL